MHPFLTRAIMRHHNDFFKMTEEEQTVFKLQKHSELDKKIADFIEKEMGTKDEGSDPAHLLKFNEIYLPYHGIGPNHFMLNEFGYGEEILEFENLYDFNVAAHKFQEEANAEDFSDYEPKELHIRFNEWARAFVNDNFYYLNLYGYQIWLLYEMEQLVYDWLEKNIPHRYVSGEDDGKETIEGYYKWDKQIDANGLEGWYQQMNDFSRNWTTDHYKEDIQDNIFGNKVFILEVGDSPTEPSLDYIFGSLEVLRNITFINFIEDCEKLRGNIDELFELKQERLSELQSAMDDEFEKVKKSPSDEVEIKEPVEVLVAGSALEE